MSVTPGVERWLRYLAEKGPSSRPPGWGAVCDRAKRAGLTDWWMLDRQTGKEMLRADVPREHVPWGDRYEFCGEALTPLGRATIDSLITKPAVRRRSRWKIILEQREDGGLRIYSDDVPGLVLASANRDGVLDDMATALKVMLPAPPTLSEPQTDGSA